MSTESTMTAEEARAELQRHASPERAATSAKFFKTGAGEYSEGDVFIGVKVPVMRSVSKTFRSMSLTEIQSLLCSSIHEERHLALMILVLSIHRCLVEHHRAAYDFYLKHTKWINNWDLVDVSAPAVVGGYLLDKSRKPLLKLAKSRSLWERRIAIVATQHFIRMNDLETTFEISRMLIDDQEDLIHKATGWMLREAGARDQSQLVAFLNEFADTMPRTMLRYAIEHFDADERQHFMSLRSATMRRGK